eukprot:Nitzschia sp. Nitz4//scaffold50_size126154//110963//112294//NITZ4_003703-RA/size126154-processed-gene-0.158-mRNA-1//1//CDS//3329553752//7015//frame0
MAMLTFSDDPPRVYEIPRLEDELIDDLFYQEDEIGEMRHTAFMIECGLEEDPPDGPDVPPVPWKLEQLQAMAPAPAPKPEKPDSERVRAARRHNPTRTASMDDVGDLEKELSPKRPEREGRPTREPVRRLAASKSGTLHNMRRSAPAKSHSSDEIEDTDLALEFAKDPDSASRSPRSRPKKLVAAKSGSLHGMRDAARRAKEKEEANDTPTSPSGREPRRSRLVATKSGTLHGMQKGLRGAPSPTKSDSSSKSPSTNRRLMKAKSGTFRPLPRKPDLNSDDSKADTMPSLPRRPSAGSESSNSSAHALMKKQADLRRKKDNDDTNGDAAQETSNPRSRLAMKKIPDKSEDDAPKQTRRVFRNGKEVFEPVNGSKVSAAMDKFRQGGTSPADLLKSMQQARTQGNDDSTPGGARTRPGRLKIPQKALSTNDAIPSAFRSSYPTK